MPASARALTGPSRAGNQQPRLADKIEQQFRRRRAKGVYQLASISHIEPEIEDRRAVRYPTDRDQIDSARGDSGDRFDRDPAGGFGYRAPSDCPHGAVEGFRVHIVE